MASVGDISVSIGLDTSRLNRSLGEVNRTLDGVKKGMGGVSQASIDMADKMRVAYQKQHETMKAFKVEQMAIKSQFHDLSASAGAWTGTTGAFMDELETLGKKQKAVTDNMMANNELMKTSFIQSVGAMLARSTASSKIADNFTRMGNPLYSVNNGLLKITGSLEGIAKQGQPAVMALKLLGPTANMKKLNDMTRLIQTGIMRFQSVFLVAGIGATLFYGKMHSEAMKANKGYAESFNAMKDVISKTFKPMVEVFAQVMPYVFNVITAVGKLVLKFQEANPFVTKLIAGFMLLIPALILILSPLAIGIGMFGGLQVAFASLAPLIMPLIAGLGAMMGTVFLVAGAVVALVAVGILLYKNWDSIVAWLKKAWETIKSTAVSVWGAMKTYFTDTWNSIKESASAIWTAIVDGVVNTFNKIVSFFKTWGVTILAVISGPIGLLALYIYKNWDAIKTKTIEIFTAIVGWFKGFASKLYTTLGIDKFVAMVVNNFNFLKDTVKIVLEMMVAVVGAIFSKIWSLVSPIVTKLVNFIQQRWTNLKNNTTQQFNALKTVLSAIWTAVSSVVKSVVTVMVNFLVQRFNTLKNNTMRIFNAIKTVVSTIFRAISSVVKSVASAILSAITNAWNKVKSTTSSVFNSMKNTVSTIFNSVKSKITSVANGILSSIKGIFGKVKSAMTKPIEDAKNKIKGMLDAISGFFKNMVMKFPTPKMPKFSVSKGSASFLGKEIPIPKFDVSWNAKGGIFNSASILGGGQGVAEKGAEMVLPIQHKRYMKPFVSGMAELLHDMQGDTSQGGNVINQFTISQLVVREQADIERIAVELERKQRKQARAKGTLSFA